MPILELLSQVDELDPNLSDNDGNTPLIFSAQAGESDAIFYEASYCVSACISHHHFPEIL